MLNVTNITWLLTVAGKKHDLYLELIPTCHSEVLRESGSTHAHRHLSVHRVFLAGCSNLSYVSFVLRQTSRPVV